MYFPPTHIILAVEAHWLIVTTQIKIMIYLATTKEGPIGAETSCCQNKEPCGLHLM